MRSPPSWFRHCPGPHVHRCIHSHTCTYALTCLYTGTYTLTCTHSMCMQHICMYIPTHTPVCVHTYMHVHHTGNTHTREEMCTFVCTHVHFSGTLNCLHFRKCTKCKQEHDNCDVDSKQDRESSWQRACDDSGPHCTWWVQDEAWTQTHLVGPSPPADDP